MLINHLNRKLSKWNLKIPPPEKINVKTNKHKGFTLSEVLITLVIIGVVAAVTIPSLVIQYQKEQTIIQLKKTYSDLTRAARLASAEYGSYDTWDYTLSNAAFFKKYFYPFISLSKNTIKNVKKDNIKYLQSSGNIEEGLLIMRDDGEIVELMSGGQIFTYSFDYKGVGADLKRKCYAVDINGYRKPNKFGRDLFMFCLDSERDIVPHCFDDGSELMVTKRENLKNGPSSYNYNCSKNSRGMWCAALIMADGWQIKEDYPW